MASVFGMGKRSEGEILDLTAPALAGEGIVARWLRDSLERTRESLADPVVDPLADPWAGPPAGPDES